MTAAQGQPRYRVLDRRAGWEAATVESLSGLDGPGLQLEPAGQPGVDLDVVSPHLPPSTLAPGCGPCDWFLVAGDPGRELAAGPSEAQPGARRILRLTACETSWRSLWSRSAPVADPVAVASSRNRLAVVDRGGARVRVFAADGRVLVASFAVDEATAVALAPGGDIWTATEGGRTLAVHDPSGLRKREVPLGLPDPIDRLGFGPSPAADPTVTCALWLATVDSDGFAALWRAGSGGDDPSPAAMAELSRSLLPTGLLATGGAGFCLTDGEPDQPGERCFDWSGRPLAPAAVDRPSPPPRAERGQLLTVPLDSGVPRCRWHRVRVDAEVPTGTTVEVAVAASEVPEPPPQGHLGQTPGWEGFEPGVPHPDDWEPVPGPGLDSLLRQPPGRYLFLRIRLRGDGAATPTIRGIQLDFPRSTGLDSLPAIYRSDPAATEFGERFLSLLDAELETVDQLVERHPALLDPQGVPADTLTWLAGLVGITFDPAWGDEIRRRLIEAAPELHRTRGTPDGLRRVIALIFEVEAAVDELGPSRPWGAIGGAHRPTGEAVAGSEPLGARLRQVRLFGRSRSRLRLGTSSLGRTPVKSFGNPEDDPRLAGAHRIRVSLPVRAGGGLDRQQVRDVIDAVTPAHVVSEVRFGGDAFLVGTAAEVGVDTRFTRLAAPILGQSVRLRRRTVLWPAPGGGPPGVDLGGTAVVGHTTALT